MTSRAPDLGAASCRVILDRLNVPTLQAERAIDPAGVEEVRDEDGHGAHARLSLSTEAPRLPIPASCSSTCAVTISGTWSVMKCPTLGRTSNR